MNRYQNGAIYKIVNNIDDQIYVGSTCLMLAKRLYDHKRTATRKPNQPVYRHLSEIGWENVRIILVEQFPCDTKDQLEQRERYWYDMLKPKLNKNKPRITYSELRTRQTLRDRVARKANRYYCKFCKYDIIDQPHYLKEHNKSHRHQRNFINHMENTVKEYQQVKPIEIVYFKLET